MSQPPRNLLQALQQLDFDEAIGPSDPRFVDTDLARGATDLRMRLLNKFGLSMTSGDFFPNLGRHVLLFGPIGCGKSTELMRLKAQLLAPHTPISGKLFPILLNVRGEVDINNLEYADLFLALAHAVVQELEAQSIQLPESQIAALQGWFSEHVLTHDQIRELATQLGTEAEAGGGWPLFVKLTAKFSAVFKNSSSYKDTMRDVVKKTFTQFALAFNALIRAAEAALERAASVHAGAEKATATIEAAATGSVAVLAKLSRDVQGAIFDDAKAAIAAFEKTASAHSVGDAVRVQADYVRTQFDVNVTRAKTVAALVAEAAQNGAKLAQDNFSRLGLKFGKAA